jgi:class 3 adenylate cyclase
MITAAGYAEMRHTFRCMGSRTCTIVFTDLVGSTAIRTEMGDVAYDELRHDHDRVMRESIDGNHGEFVKHEGDGVMAVFASASDAVACAVAMQDRVMRQAGRPGARFVMRVGASAGDVAEEHGDFHGTPVVEAARLCNAAAGGTIVVADVVRVLAGTRTTHAFTPAGELELKGLGAPVVAWEVEWTTDAAPALLPARLTEVVQRGACVGRETELEQLGSAWKAAEAGTRALFLVAGEPGIGKTRLAAELAASVIDDSTVVHGWCDENLGVPFQPWVHVVGALLRSLPDAELASAAHVAPDLARLLPDISARFGDVTPTVSVDSETDRTRLFDAIDALLAQLAARRPLLVVLDDLHWADQPTLALLRWLLRSERGGAVLFLATYRDTDVDRRHPFGSLLADVRRDARVARITLGGLDERGLAALLSDRAGHDAPPEFVRVVYDETEGNPFFIEEVLAHLVETGAIVQRDGQWTSDLPAEALGLPEGVRDVVGRRLSLLSDTANELLTVAAIVGREFDLATLLDAGDVARDDAIDAVDAALARGLLTEVSGSVGRYAFSHALVRQTLVEEVRGPRKARLHWRIGEALVARGAPNSVVAFHLCEGVLAGDARRAAESAVAAAEAAIAIAAAEDARSLAERVVEVLDDAGLDEPELRCRALLVIGEVSVMFAIDYGIGRPAIVEASRLARRFGWTEYACRATVAYSFTATPGLTDPDLREMSLSGLDLDVGPEWRPVLEAIASRFYSLEGDWDEQNRLIAAALTRIDDCSPLGRLIVVSTESLRRDGTPDLAARTTHAEEVWALAEASGSAFWMVVAGFGRLTCAARAGDRDGFERYVDLLMKIVRPGGSADDTHPDISVFDSTRSLLDARWADAERRATEKLAEIDPASSNFWQCVSQIAAVNYYTGRDDDELLRAIGTIPPDQKPQRALIELVQCAVNARRGQRDPLFDRFAANGFADLPLSAVRLGALSNAGMAAAWLRDADAAAILEPIVAEYAGQLFVGPAAGVPFEPADSVRGMLLGVLGRHDEAVASFEAAAELCAKGRFVAFGVMNEHRLAAALIARNGPGDCDRARTLATEARARAEELGMRPDVRFAQLVLDQVA